MTTYNSFQHDAMSSFKSVKLEYSSSIKHEALRRRLHNIKSFSELSREGLVFGQKERMLLLYETAMCEKIFIQYPGKESVASSEEKIRPWDFRPKLQLSDGTYMKDLSFADIWDDIAEMRDCDDNALAVLAAVFFHMSLMVGYKQQNQECEFTDCRLPEMNPLGSGKLLLNWFRINLPEDILDYLNEKAYRIRNASIEAYLVYNDLLVQNEDCKYFYKDTYVNRVEWNNKVGRNNTMLSHISVIEYLEGRIKFSEIMGRFQRGMGVAPIPVSRVSDVTKGLIIR